MSPRILIFQHTEDCPPGTLGDHIASDGLKPTIVEFHGGDAIPDLADFDILIAMGGGMNIWEEAANPWLVSEKAAIRRWVRELDKPYLGVCLGHQLLADALGGEVRRAPKPEVALLGIDLTDEGRRHPLFQGFGAEKRALQWHGAEVTALPSGGAVLASSKDCAVAAFGVGSAAFGLQYHIEATPKSIADWSAGPASAWMLEGLPGPDAAPRLRAEVASAMPELFANSRRFYDNFLRIARDHPRSARRTAAGVR